MGLVGQTLKQKIEIPHEAGEWLEIVPLSWAHLETARRLKTEDAIKQASMFDAEMLKNIQSQAEATTTDPSDGLDIATVLKHGIVGWSYEESLTAEHIELLDEQTALFAFEAIASRSVLSGDEQKNGVAPPNAVS
jgi:hypothetical protein